jgi:hypothetical protein
LLSRKPHETTVPSDSCAEPNIAETNKRLAEKKGDAELVNKWSAEMEKIAVRLVKSPLPTDPEEIQAAQ